MPIVDITTSAVGTHLAGTMVFVLIGYRKVSFLWFLVWLATLTMVAATNRGATLAVLGPVVFAMLMLGRLRLLLTAMLAVVGIFAVLLTVESTFTQDNEAEGSAERPVSAHQIVKNAESIVGDSGEQNVEGTKRWRLNWWDIIINDTIYGPNFWTGRGFGMNLADADGFAGPADHAASSSANTKPAQRAHDSVGTRRSAGRRVVVARAHILGRHDAERDAGRPHPRTQAMGRPVLVRHLLR